MTTATRKKKADAPEQIASIKGFNKDLTCRGFQFEEGKTYEHDGTVSACASGFHACDAAEHPLNVFQFYAPATSRYFDVTQAGALSRDGDGAKVASAKITLGVEISLHDLALRAVEFVMSRTKGKDKQHNKAVSGAASNSGVSGAASNSGDSGAASNSGYRGAASNSGYRGAASNSGVRGAAFSHAPYSKVMCAGDGQALYNTEFASDGSIASVACGITGRDGVKAGVWYVAKAGKLVAA